jgi:hypothetical protein
MTGIYIKKTGTFYHMEYGNVDAPKATAVDRVIRTLLQRGIIEYDIGPEALQTPYKVMSQEEAEQMGAKLEAIPLSQNIKDNPVEQPKRKGAR